MPFYSVRKKQSDLVQPLPLMSYTDFQKFLQDNPEYEQVIDNAPAVKVN